jgi:hypothetical protein
MGIFQQMKSGTRSALLGLVALVLFFSSSTLFAAEPTYGLASVDGDSSEWTSSDFIADMYKAGDPTKEVLSQLYMRYDCNTETMFVFVSSNGVSLPILTEDGEEVWIKVDGPNNKVVTSDDEGSGSTPDFAWVGKPLTADTTAKGWEGSFHLAANGTYDIEVHCNVWEDDLSQTSSTVDLTVTVNCGELDFGDAPNSGCYDVAGHNIVYGGEGPKVKLGSTVDAEPSYDGNVNADDDDFDGYNDDEEAVTFYKKNPDGTYTLISGDKFKKGDDYRVVVSAELYPGESATLAAWFDFFADCAFGNEQEELIINNVTLANGGTEIATITYTQDFTVPAGATEATTYLRFRLNSPVGTLSPTGIPSGYGEVEDYVTSIGSEEPVSVDLATFSATPVADGIKVEWNVMSEINHAGYNLYRANSQNGDYVRLNAALIGFDPATSALEEQHYEFIDSNASATSFYKLEDISLDGQSEWHGPIQATVLSAVESSIELPTEFELMQNYPNPFNPTTTISYALPNRSDMTLNVYDVNGRLIRTLVNGVQSAGSHSVTWNGLNSTGEMVPSGLYIYRMSAGDFSKTGRMTLLK